MTGKSAIRISERPALWGSRRRARAEQKCGATL